MPTLSPPRPAHHEIVPTLPDSASPDERIDATRGFAFLVPAHYTVTRTDAAGIETTHTVRPEHREAFTLCLALDGGLSTLNADDEAEVLRQLDVALGYGDAAADDTEVDDDAPASVNRTNQQRLAIRMEQEFGYSRDARLALASRTFRRAVESFNELTNGECARLWNRAVELNANARGVLA